MFGQALVTFSAFFRVTFFRGLRYFFTEVSRPIYIYIYSERRKEVYRYRMTVDNLSSIDETCKFQLSKWTTLGQNDASLNHVADKTVIVVVHWFIYYSFSFFLLLIWNVVGMKIFSLYYILIYLKDKIIRFSTYF